MKLKDLRQKYNGLLQKFIRLFSLTSVAFVVTACYGVAPPYDIEEVLNVQGQVLGENDEPLASKQVIVKRENRWEQNRDTLLTQEDGTFQAQYKDGFFYADSIKFVVYDANGVYETDSLSFSTNDVVFEDEGMVNEHLYRLSYSLRADIRLKKK